MIMESERLERLDQNRFNEEYYDDRKFCDRLCAFLEIDPHDCTLVDAAYFDFSVLPEDQYGHKIMSRDAYLVFCIKDNGEYLSRWIDRWDLDSDDPIIAGKCEHPPYDPQTTNHAPEIKQKFNPDLLSTPCPSFFDIFKGK